jgi:hypothetical protein
MARSRNKIYLDSDSLLLNITQKLDDNLEKVGTAPRMEAKPEQVI